MPLKLMYITNNPIVAIAAEKSGVDWIFIDLETIGKELRQPNMDTVKSKHSISDIKMIKGVLSTSQLLVRVNPINENSQEEIDLCVINGADILMLPYFRSKSEVITFLDIVKGRSKTCLLLETPEAVVELDNILIDDRIDYIHIGLNDLHLGFKLKFMFELLSNGMVENIIDKIRKTNIIYGFGGIAGLGEGDLPAELILKEHYRLNSSLAILSRTFYNQNGTETNIRSIMNIIKPKIERIRDFENEMIHLKESDFELNRVKIKEKVQNIVDKKVYSK